MLGKVKIEYHNKFSLTYRHFAITHNPWVWRLVNIVIEVVVGMSTYSWCYQVSSAMPSVFNGTMGLP